MSKMKESLLSAKGAQGYLTKALLVFLAGFTLLLSSTETQSIKSPWTKVVDKVEIHYSYSSNDPDAFVTATEHQSSTQYIIRWGHEGEMDGIRSLGTTLKDGKPLPGACAAAEANQAEYEIVVTAGKAALLNQPGVVIQLPPSIGQHAEFKIEFPLNHQIEVIPDSATEKLRRESYLRPRLLGRKVFPTRLVATSQFGMATARFLFPREAAPGEPIIRGGESSVTFVLANGKDRVSAKFNPREMACPGGGLP